MAHPATPARRVLVRGGRFVRPRCDGRSSGRGRRVQRLDGQPHLVPVTFAVFIGLVVMGGVLIIADVVNPIAILG